MPLNASKCLLLGAKIAIFRETFIVLLIGKYEILCRKQFQFLKKMKIKEVCQD